jgi:hypothetical protein
VGGVARQTANVGFGGHVTVQRITLSDLPAFTPRDHSDEALGRGVFVRKAAVDLEHLEILRALIGDADEEMGWRAHGWLGNRLISRRVAAGPSEPCASEIPTREKSMDAVDAGSPRARLAGKCYG